MCEIVLQLGNFLTAGAAKITLTPVHASGIAMRPDSQSSHISAKQLLLMAVMFLVVFSLNAQTIHIVPVNIFGDGNPENGVEDSRQQLMNGRDRGVNLADQPLNAGTIKCDGKVRGTAMVIDTREFAPDLKGVVLASAAHVLYDLDKKKRFKRCEFQFLALGELARYRAKIDLKRVRKGGFDPLKATEGPEFGEGDWAFLYVPKPWKIFNRDEALTLRDFSFSQMESYKQSGGEVRLVAYDSSLRVISVSRDCTVIESSTDDLGGGGWKGQLLDDCDSGGGASGGGIVAVLNHQHYLIGIRSGSHWSEQDFPSDAFPGGPPDGAVWNRHSNTNFGRAIDAYILQELQKFTHLLERGGSAF
jgi:hypothetical protein